VNNGGATGADVMALARAIQQDVLERFGVELEPEPVFI
jgi:UDP-N-acetylmuramate dehydrogenase